MPPLDNQPNSTGTAPVNETNDRTALAPHIEQTTVNPTGPAVQPVAPANQDQIIITREQLKQIAEDIKADVLESSAAQIGKLQETNAMLLEIADTKLLGNWMQKHRKAAGTFVRLSTYKDKVITKWVTVEDIVTRDINTGRWLEKQLMRVTFEDDTTADVEYSTFTDMLRRTQVLAKVIERTMVDTEDPDVKKFRFKVKREDNGAEYDIMDTFVN